MKARLIGSIFGFCIGDALGLPVEFRSRLYLNENPVSEMIGYGTYNQPAGTWSDDTSMMLCTAEALCTGYDPEKIASLLVRWYTEAYWTAHEEVFDIGNTTRRALASIKRGARDWRSSGSTDTESNGNGALPRMLPPAWYFRDAPASRKLEVAREVAAITHAHSRSICSCVIYLLFAAHLSRGTAVLEAYRRTCEEAADLLEDEEDIGHFHRFLGGNLGKMPEDEIESSGYCVHSLEAAVWSILTTASFRDAVERAVNLGGDTDSIGALAGGLAGIRYGSGSIPGEWIRYLAGNRDIMKLTLRFLRVINYAHQPL